VSWELLVEGALGVFLVGLTLVDVFQSIVVPRRAPRSGPGSLLVRALWQVWQPLADRAGSPDRREGVLASFGALAVILLLVFWLGSLILGYGLILYALRAQVKPPPENLFSAMYFGGTSMLTIGFGDIAPTGGLARLVTLVAAATGLGLFALVISFLFTLYGGFTRREVAVVSLEAAAGAPPSGITLLESYALGGILDDLPRLFEAWQAWAAEILDSHLAYPVLAYFRSSHDNDSWISSLGAVMDASTLVLTTIEGGPKGWAKLCNSVGGHCLEDLVQYFGLPDPRDGPQVERSEFEEACDRLERAGYAVRARDEAWQRFAGLRSGYAGRVNALARYWSTPPAQWIGDRSPLRYPLKHYPLPATAPGAAEPAGLAPLASPRAAASTAPSAAPPRPPQPS
jgi:hypothetical protein